MPKQSTAPIFSQSALLGNSDLANRPFARRMAEAHPELWQRFVAACEREHAEPSIADIQRARRARESAARAAHVESFNRFRQAA